MERSSRCSNGQLNRRSHYLSIIEQQQNLPIQYYSKIDRLSIMIDSFIPMRRPKRCNNNKYRSKAFNFIYKPYYYPASKYSLTSSSIIFLLFLLLFYLQIIIFRFFIPSKDEHDNTICFLLYPTPDIIMR